MLPVFADTSFWLALFDPHDFLHDAAKREASHRRRILTSDWIVVETMNSLARKHQQIRQYALSFFRVLPTLGHVCLPCTREHRDEALQLYSSRLDKGWSLTDCSSFIIMGETGLQRALTSDRHFTQAGFEVLLSN
jgi:predicted nucleic acid-binding protein